MSGTSDNEPLTHRPVPDDPLVVLQHLARANVPFIVIGGLAVNFHGYVRTTEDADIVFLRSPTAERMLCAALESIHACWISTERDSATGLERLVPITLSYVQAQHLMMLVTDLGFLDIYDYIPGFPDTPPHVLLQDAVSHGDVKFVSLPWLRRLKQRAGRHRDLDDLEHLPPCDSP